MLLPGLLIALVLFGAAIWSASEALRQSGFARLAHLAMIAGLFLTMAALSASQPILAQIAGAFLVAAGLAASWVSRGWSRLLPLALAIFGATVVSGLPFGPG